jgi:hypothetical protein
LQGFRPFFGWCSCELGAGHDAGNPTVRSSAGTPLCLVPEVLTGGAATRQSDVHGIDIPLFRALGIRRKVFTEISGR